MSQVREISKNTFVLALARLIEKASTIFLAFFVSRALGVTGLGIYSAAMVYYGLIFTAAEMGSATLLLREIAKDRERTSRYVVHFGVMATAMSVVIIVLFLGITPHLGYSADLRASVYVILLAIIPGTLRNIQEAVFVAHQRAGFITYTGLLTGIVNIATSVYLLKCGYGIVSLVAAFVIVQYCGAILGFFLMNRYVVALTWEFNPRFAVTLLSELKTFAGSSLLGGFFARPEIMILSLMKNEAQIGFYSAALKLVDLWQLVPQTYMTNVLPVLARSYHLADQKSQLILDKSIKYLLAFSLPLAAGLFVAAQPIVNLVYGRGFEPAVLPLRLLAWNIPLGCLFSILWRVLVARGQQDSVLRAQVVTTLTRLGGGYVLIASFASLGAAITTPLSLLFHNLLLAFWVRRDGTRLGVLRLGWRLGLAALGMAVLTWALSHRLQLWALVLIAAVCYAALFFLLRVFSQEDYTLFRKAWRSQMAVSRES